MRRYNALPKKIPALQTGFSSFLLLAFVAIGCIGGNNSLADQPQGNKVDQTSQGQEAIAKSVEEDVDSKSSEKIAEKRKQIIKEAVTALSETRKALRALDEKETDEALKSLEKATGKLEIILARDPDLALAPTHVTVKTLDLLTTRETIEKAKKEAEEALDKGHVQQARALLDKLGSEIVINVTNIPLATYPEAIKAVTPLIDAGKLDEAKRALIAALNTLVVTEHVIPLPVARASSFLAEAEKLSEQEDRRGEEDEKLAELIEDARNQLEMAEALGYGRKSDYQKFYDQLDLIEQKTGGGKSGSGFFDQLNARIDKLTESLFN